MRKKLRQIVVDGRVFLWRFTPAYRRIDDPANSYECCDRFIAYAVERRNSPLIIHFVTLEDAILGGALRCGAPIELGDTVLTGVNLHQPQWAARLIQFALQQGWQPLESDEPMVINGVEWLANLQQQAIENHDRSPVDTIEAIP